MDYRSTIEDLNTQIEKLTSIRDGLVELTGGHVRTRNKKPISAATRKKLADSMRQRWAEQKRKQRAGKRKPRKAHPTASASSAGQ